jgi:LemA protein
MHALIGFSIVTVVILAAAILSPVALAITIYNRLVNLKTNCDNAFSQIEVQLKRRYDLIPNLVECVKRYMLHERETLERVIAARNQAAAELRQATEQAGNAEALQKWMGAEGTLAGALGRLSVVMESYPELKANAAVADLTEQLTSTENRIAYARQAYNDWVSGFNIYRQGFPGCLLAALLGFKQNRSFVEFADREKIAEAPQVVMA